MFYDRRVLVYKRMRKMAFSRRNALAGYVSVWLFAGRTLYVPFRVNKYRYIIITLSSQCPFPQGAKAILGESAN